MKTKALISFAFTAKLICVFVFAYAKSWFSHDEAQLSAMEKHFEINIKILMLLMVVVSDNTCNNCLAIGGFVNIPFGLDRSFDRI